MRDDDVGIGPATARHRVDDRVLVLFCVASSAVLLPIAIRYALAGAAGVALGLGFLVVLYAGFALIIRRRRHAHPYNRLLAAVATVATLGPVYTLGVVASPWLFPLILVNFYMLHRYAAMVVNVFAVLFACAVLAPSQDALALGHLLATASAVLVFGYGFAWGAERQRETLLRMSLQDPLTGLGNRRALDQALADADDGADVGSAGCALLACDLDHFKRINDRYGHVRGDRILRSVAALLRERVGAGNRIFRYGGEEFVVMCPGADCAGAHDLAKTLRDAIARLDGAAVTLSIGVAVHAPGETALACLQRADAALYRAKRDGRDRVAAASAAEEGQASPPPLPGRSDPGRRGGLDAVDSADIPCGRE